MKAKCLGELPFSYMLQTPSSCLCTNSLTALFALHTSSQWIAKDLSQCPGSAAIVKTAGEKLSQFMTSGAAKAPPVNYSLVFSWELVIITYVYSTIQNRFHSLMDVMLHFCNMHHFP